MRDRIFLWLSVVFLSTLAFLSQTFKTFVISPAAAILVGAKRSVSAFVLAKFGGSRLGLPFLNYTNSAKTEAAAVRQRAEKRQTTAGWRLCPSV